MSGPKDYDDREMEDVLREAWEHELAHPTQIEEQPCCTECVGSEEPSESPRKDGGR